MKAAPGDPEKAVIFNGFGAPDFPEASSARRWLPEGCFRPRRSNPTKMRFLLFKGSVRLRFISA
jgi:hypothetical protein